MNEQNGNRTEPQTEIETAADKNIWPLDDATIELLAEFRQQAQAIDAQTRGALLLFARQHALTGNWQIAGNGRELIRQP